TGAWRIILSRTQFPALSKKVKGFARAAATLYEDKGTELVFKLAAGTIQSGFRKRDDEVPPGPLPSVAFKPKPEPDDDEIGKANLESIARHAAAQALPA